MITVKIWFGLLLMPVVFGVDFDYLTTVIKTKATKCQSRLHKLLCYMKCGDEKAVCVNDNCSCLSYEVETEFKSRINNEYENEDSTIDYIDSGEDAVQDQTRNENALFYALRPTLRHHIAHFCPNLDIARECIKKCMTQGKPAFCGKDHVCYCGHKYSHTDNNSGVDVKGMYEQFHDLYTKYFGPGDDTKEEQSSEEKIPPS